MVNSSPFSIINGEDGEGRKVREISNSQRETFGSVQINILSGLHPLIVHQVQEKRALTTLKERLSGKYNEYLSGKASSPVKF